VDQELFDDPADALVVFGISGDLARKMTFAALYRLERRGMLTVPVVGVALDPWDDDTMREHARQAIVAAGEEFDETVFSRLAGRMSYVSGDYMDPETYVRVAAAVGTAKRPMFYLEIPPSLFASVVDGLAGQHLTTHARVVVEKPFGHDLASAQALNAELRTVLQERQILRIDHFLGKAPASHIMFMRFANTVFEPVWSRDHIQSVQITMAEDFGVDDRGSFYDPVGALRDVVQNHLLQMLALVAMEPPSSGSADAMQDRRTDVFRAMPDAEPSRYVRGQYQGYRSVAGVRPRSRTETFAALRLEVDNWRWAGVPFFIRAGKAMPERVTELRIVFKRPPRILFAASVRPEPDQLVIRVDPDPGAGMRVQAKDPGGNYPRSVDLSLVFEDELGEPAEPYERLLGMALRGDSSLYSRMDLLEETWRIVQPLLDDPPPVQSYAKGTWGPAAAQKLLDGWPGWHDPWLPKPSS
jgi:glucose-6-phosphate 1-dehydrogenase